MDPVDSMSKPEEVVDLGNLDLSGPPVELRRGRRVEDTRATLAYLLFGMLAVVLAVMLGLLAAGTLNSHSFDNVAGVLLAPIVGLLGAATGYYYGRGER